MRVVYRLSERCARRHRVGGFVFYGECVSPSGLQDQCRGGHVPKLKAYGQRFAG